MQPDLFICDGNVWMLSKSGFDSSFQGVDPQIQMHWNENLTQFSLGKEYPDWI